MDSAQYAPGVQVHVFAHNGMKWFRSCITDLDSKKIKGKRFFLSFQSCVEHFKTQKNERHLNVPHENTDRKNRGSCGFSFHPRLARRTLFSGETLSAMYSTHLACMPFSLSHKSLPVSISLLHFFPRLNRCAVSIAFIASESIAFTGTLSLAGSLCW